MNTHAFYTPLEDGELVRRALRGFGEMFAAVGRSARGAQGEIRRSDLLGAHLGANGHPFFDSAVTPESATPPADAPDQPTNIWTIADAVPGRVSVPDGDIPCMGLDLHDPALALNTDGVVPVPISPQVLAAINERAYNETGFGVLIGTLDEPNVQLFGLRQDQTFVCVAMTVAADDDLSIHYVATEADYRRRGLASRLVSAILLDAKNRGFRSSTLQASPEGLLVWQRLGYRPIVTVRCFTRPLRFLSNL